MYFPATYIYTPTHTPRLLTSAHHTSTRLARHARAEACGVRKNLKRKVRRQEINPEPLPKTTMPQNRNEQTAIQFDSLTAATTSRGATVEWIQL